ncbi:MAG: DUF3568 family protein [Phycisphaeraceae bacterium]
MNGCIAAAAAVPVFSIAAASMSTADKGYGFWKGSKLRYVDETNMAAMRWAVEKTIDRLGLTIDKYKQDEDKPYYRWVLHHDEGDELATITLERVSRRMMAVTIDVGMFGDKASGRLIASRMQTYLNEYSQATGEMPSNLEPPPAF